MVYKKLVYGLIKNLFHYTSGMFNIRGYKKWLFLTGIWLWIFAMISLLQCQRWPILNMTMEYSNSIHSKKVCNSFSNHVASAWWHLKQFINLLIMTWQNQLNFNNLVSFSITITPTISSRHFKVCFQLCLLIWKVYKFLQGNFSIFKPSLHSIWVQYIPNDVF